MRTRYLAIALVASLLVVPTLVRAHQHAEPLPTRPGVRLGISDAPPTRADVIDYDATADVMASRLIAEVPRPEDVVWRSRAPEEAVLVPLFLKAPDTPRGPPALSIA